MTDTTQETKPKQIDIFALPNVRNHEKEPVKLENLPIRLTQYLWTLAKEYPLWTFKMYSYRSFEVLKDGESLGYVGEEWYGRNYALFVRNDRIAQQNERKNAYHTQDISKAMLRVKKMFSPMTMTERVAKARFAAEGVLVRQARGNNRLIETHDAPIRKSMMEYARENFSQYVLWLKERHDLTMLAHLKELEEAKVDMATIQETQKAFDSKGKHALIVLADGKYIVKVLDNVQLYDDTTLPVDLRGKLGMLKLVEDEQMVTGIGCRVSNEIFVVLHESNVETETQK